MPLTKEKLDEVLREAFEAAEADVGSTAYVIIVDYLHEKLKEKNDRI